MSARRDGRLLSNWWLAALVLIVAVAAGVTWTECADDNGPTPTPAPNPAPTPAPTPTPSPTALPDFVISNVTVSPDLPLIPPGQVTITATVRNVGSAGYSGFILVEAPTGDSGGLSALAAGAADIVVINFPAVAANATYTFALVVDPSNVIAEVSETNNESSTIVINTGP